MKVVNRWIIPAMTPKTRKAAMTMIAFTIPGMRSQFDLQEPADELMQPESGRVELVSRGRTIEFVIDAINSNSTNELERKPMPYC